MNPGDIIKIGRITLRIRDIYFSNNKNINQTILNESINSNIKEINILKTDGDPLTNANSSKKIIYVEYATWKKKATIIHYFNLAYVPAR